MTNITVIPQMAQEEGMAPPVTASSMAPVPLSITPMVTISCSMPTTAYSAPTLPL